MYTHLLIYESSLLRNLKCCLKRVSLAALQEVHQPSRTVVSVQVYTQLSIV